MADGIAAAQSIIDGKLQTKYIVPFAAPVPKLINTIAKTLAAAWALANAFSGAEGSEQLTFAKSLHALGMSMLDQVHAGTMILTDATLNTAIGSNRSPMVVTSCPDYQLLHLDMLGLRGPKRPGHRNVYPDGGFGIAE